MEKNIKKLTVQKSIKTIEILLEVLDKTEVLLHCVLHPLTGKQESRPLSPRYWIIHNRPEIYFGTTHFLITQHVFSAIKIEAYEEENEAD